MELESYLRACLSPENQIRKQAEDIVKQLSSRPQIIPELTKLIQQSADAEVRQLSAVLLRKRVTRFWLQLSAEVRRGCQAALLQCIAVEPHHIVRRSVADVVGVIAKSALPRGEWGELMGFLGQCSTAGDATHREIALMLFTSLTESVGDHLAPHVADLMAVITAGLQDSCQEVVMAALRATEPLLFIISSPEDISRFHNLLAVLLKVAKECNNEAIAVLACQVVVEVVEVAVPAVGPHLQGILQLAMSLALSTNLERESRDQALQVVHWVARFKPKQLAKNKAMLRELVGSLLTMSTEGLLDEEAAAEGVVVPGKMATQALDALALNVSSNQIVPPVLEFALPASKSADPAVRCAVQNAIAAIAEGCSETLTATPRLREVLNVVLAGLDDGHPAVRSAAAFGMGQLSEFLQPSILDYYDTVIPRLLARLDDPSPSVRERTCYALDAFVECLDDKVEPYLSVLLERLLAVLAGASGDIAQHALSALASTISAAAEKCEPYAGVLLPAIIPFLTSSAHDLVGCRARATECVGLLLEGVSAGGPSGKAIAVELAPKLMELGLAAFHMHNHELREYTHGMFTCIAKALAADFAPYLPYVVPLAIATCGQEDGVLEAGEQSDSDSEGVSGDEEGGGRDGSFNIRTGLLDEKCAATQALGVYASQCPAAFKPLLQETLAMVLRMAGYLHEEVRVQAYEALANLVISCHSSTPGMPGGPPAAATTEILSAVLPVLTGALEDDERCCMSAALAALMRLTETLGATVMGPQMQKMCDAIEHVLKGDAPSQAHDSDEDFEEEEDDEGGPGEEEEELVSAAGELLIAIIKAVGRDTYAPVLQSQHLKPLINRMKPSQSDGVRGVVVGILAELAEQMNGHLAPYLETLLVPLQRELRSAQAVNRQNAAFCAGVLVEGVGAAAAPHLMTVLQALQPLFSKDEVGETRDNAVAAVCRILAAAPTAVPLDALLPHVVERLPLVHDLAEAPAAVRCLSSLMTGDASATAVSPFMPQLITLMVAQTRVAGVTPEVTTTVAATASALSLKYPEAMAKLVAGMRPEDQEDLKKMVNSLHN